MSDVRCQMTDEKDGRPETGEGTRRTYVWWPCRVYGI